MNDATPRMADRVNYYYDISPEYLASQLRLKGKVVKVEPSPEYQGSFRVTTTVKPEAPA